MAKKQKNSMNFGISLIVIGLLVAVLLLVLTNLQRNQAAERSHAASAPKTTGNMAPSGAHYNLNLIGVPKGKTASMTGDNGHRMFVPLAGSCKINLGLGAFNVVDANCTDGTGSFTLPNPDPDNDGVTEYSVWVRALGAPGGKSALTGCATDPTTGELYCNATQVVSVRGTGKSTFSNVSRDLLYIYADLNGDGTPERYNLFSDSLQDYFWQYDNNGLKLLQMRFYDISTDINVMP